MQKKNFLFILSDIFKSIFFNIRFLNRDSLRSLIDQKITGSPSTKIIIPPIESIRMESNGIESTSLHLGCLPPYPKKYTKNKHILLSSETEPRIEGKSVHVMSDKRTGTVLRECYRDSEGGTGFEKQITTRGTNVRATGKILRPERDPELAEYHSMEGHTKDLFHPKLFGLPKSSSGNPVAGESVTDSEGRHMLVWYPGLPAPALSLDDLLERRKICKENIFLLVPEKPPWTDPSPSPLSLIVDPKKWGNLFLDLESWRYEILLATDKWVDVTEDPRCIPILCPSNLRIDMIPDDNVRFVEGHRVPVPVLPPKIFSDRRNNKSMVR